MSNALATTGIFVQRRSGTVTILTSSVANPSVITFSSPHGFATGQSITIAGHSGATPAINGAQTATVVNATQISIPVNVTVGGTGGTAAPTTATYTTVAEIVKVTPPGYSRNKMETSTHNDGTESYILGVLRQKDAALTVNYLASDATHASVLADMLGNVKSDWKVLFPSAVQFAGPARVQQLQIADAPVDGVQQADITLTWAGPVVQS